MTSITSKSALLLLTIMVFMLPVAEAANKKPIVNAGRKQTVNEQTLVVLNGSANDKDGSIVGYAWVQSKGLPVTISAADTDKPSFTAPSLVKTATLSFRLTVTDNLGAKSSASTVVTIKPVNAKPIANAGASKTIALGSPVALDGSQSSDTDGSISFQWKQTAGTKVKLLKAKTATPSFTSPRKLKNNANYTELAFTLTVTDNEKAKATDKVSIWATSDNGGSNVNPVAKASASKSVVSVATNVTLDGSLSKDPDGSISSYNWQNAAGATIGSNSTAVFTSPASVDKNTEFTFNLTVTDNNGAKDSATLLVKVNKPLLKPVISSIKATNKQVSITWKPVSGANKYHICYATEIITDAFDCKTANTNGKLWPEQTTTSASITGLTNNKTYHFVVIATDEAMQTASDEVTASPTALGALNDTGIITCATEKTNGLVCPQKTYPGQDAEYGLDHGATNNSDGFAGFSFTKISSIGNSLPANSADWACVKDNITGLLWERKTTDARLHDYRKSFTYYAATDTDYGAATDVSGFIKSVNAEQLCNAGDWRLPTVDELQSLVHYGTGVPDAAVDKTFFPDIATGSTGNNDFRTSSFKTATTDLTQYTVDFFNGEFGFTNKKTQKAVRLVRADTTTSDNAERYSLSADGTEVTDLITGLIWRRCSEGMSWTGTLCNGTATAFAYAKTLTETAATAKQAGKDWRLPNIKELNSLAINKDSTPMTIDNTIFPGTSITQYWSASPVYNDAGNAWTLSFSFESKPARTKKTAVFPVRLVRDIKE